MRRYRNTAVVGSIRSRLLVNALVDPDETARRLPAGVRPHVIDGGTVIGCCLLHLADVRPAGVPRIAGPSFHAVAHRISVEWTDADGETTTGVFVPVRLTQSLLPRAIGGRAFPGVHRAATIAASDEGLRWSVIPRHATDDAVQLTAHEAGEARDACEPIGGTCLAATVGVSVGLHGSLEAARMEPAHREARPVDVTDLHSTFIASFASAQPAPSYVMRDVGVRWSAVDLSIDTREGVVR
jgi:hypothetical protein